MNNNNEGELKSPQKEIKNLKNLEWAAELSSSCYLKSIEKLKSKSNSSLTISLIASIVISFVSIIVQIHVGNNLILSQVIGIMLAFIAIGVAIFSLSDKIFGWNEKIASYDFAYKILRSYIRDSKWFRDNELTSLDEEIAAVKSKNLQQKYSSLVGSLPPNNLTTNEFLECKKDLKLKIHISKMLDSNPCIDIKKAYECNNLNDEVDSGDYK